MSFPLLCPVKERDGVVYRVIFLFRLLCVSLLMEDYTGEVFSAERAGINTKVLTVPGSNTMIQSPVKSCLQHRLYPLGEVNHPLVPAWQSNRGLMQRGEFLLQLRQNPWQTWSMGAETLKVTLSSLVASTNEGAVG